MQQQGWEVVGRDYQKLLLDKSIGEAVKGLVRRRWPNNAAKQMERSWELDAKTAKNVATNGNVSERTLTKAIRAEGWGFLAALGEELIGEQYADYLHRITEREANVQRDREAERDRVRALETKARGLHHLPTRARPQ